MTEHAQAGQNALRLDPGHSAAGMGLAALAIPPGVLLMAGGLGVVISGAYSLWQAAWERQHRGPETMPEFEHRWDDESRGPCRVD